MPAVEVGEGDARPFIGGVNIGQQQACHCLECISSLSRFLHRCDIRAKDSPYRSTARAVGTAFASTRSGDMLRCDGR